MRLHPLFYTILARPQPDERYNLKRLTLYHLSDGLVKLFFGIFLVFFLAVYCQRRRVVVF